ncbi:Telomerase protein component 1 [Rhizoctonia solani]|uniref:Telomerase protein component 1 n=1 Tax=Rhizoctonia solani TaxID=456999 RepID=A0A0K6G4P0_9AGAM|nr:Telomerase protein component 1 [Rhizoctonia solani]
MHIREKIQGLKQTIKSIAFRAPDVDSVSADNHTASTASAYIDAIPSNLYRTYSAEHRRRDWPNFHTLYETLGNCVDDDDRQNQTRWADQFIRYLAIFKAKLAENQGYGILQSELEALFGELKCLYDRGVPPDHEMTNAMRGLYSSIDYELLRLKEIWDRRTMAAYHEVEHDKNRAMECYHQIHGHLRRILPNIRAWQHGVADPTDVMLMPYFLGYPIAQLQLPRYHFHDDIHDILPCATGTRVHVLGEIKSWVDDSGSGFVYWINGMAGTGKTAIACSLCEQLNEQHKLAASHFCSSSLPGCQDTRLIIASIACQFAEFSWPFRRALSKILALKDPEWHHNSHMHSPDLLFTSLISEPLLEIKHASPVHPVVVIDAMDECTDKKSSRQLLEILLTSASDLGVKFIISSRPEPQVRDLMDNRFDQEAPRVILHALGEYIMRQDMTTYFRNSLSLVPGWREKPRPPVNLPANRRGAIRRVKVHGDESIQVLARQSGSLFIWAATLFQEISAMERSRIPTEGTALIAYLETLQYKRVRVMYNSILQAALDDVNLNEIETEDMRRVLYLVARTKEPLEIQTISRLLKFNDTNRVWASLRPLWSVLHVSKDKETVKPLHPSFPQHILDPSYSGEYCCDPRVYGHRMALRCFQYFQAMRPRFNICKLESSHMSDSRVARLEQRVQDMIPANLFYAAQNWVVHLGFVPVSFELLLMTLSGCIYQISESIRLIKEWAESSSTCSENLKALMHDAWRFTKTFTLGAVSTSTPHIYVSMLPFWSSHSPITKSHAGHKKGMIGIEGTALDRQQDALLATWRFDNTTMSPVVSPDGSQVAVGVGRNVLILSASTGRLALPPFKGHSDLVLAVRFSPDGTRVVSSSLDHTTRVWNVQDSSTIVVPIEGGVGIVNSVAFSLDGLCIASGYQDGTLLIWCSLTGAPLIGPLTGHTAIRQVKYASHGRWVAVCTRNSIVTRNAEDGKTLQVFLANSNDAPYSSMDISPDCMRVASATIENNIYLWDVESGDMLLGPLSPVKIAYDYEPFVSISFSPDGSRLASSSPDRSLCVWDTQTGTLLDGPMKGHTDSITSLSFSPDGSYIISGSHDNTLRLWSIQNISPKLELLPGPVNLITSVGFSCDGTQIVSSSIDGNICTWDSQNGDMLSSSEVGDMGRVLDTNSTVKDHTLAESPASLILLDSWAGHTTAGPIQLARSIQFVVFSSDGIRIMLTLIKNTVRVLTVDTREILLEFYAPISSQSRWAHITSIASSPDGSRVAIGSMHYSFSIHDLHNGKLLYGPFDGYTNKSNALAFSPDGTRIVSGSFSTVQVQDVQTGEIVLGPLKGHTGWVTSVDYSPDGAYIVSGARDSSICVWDAQTGDPVIGPVKWHTGAVNSVKFSHDGARIVSGSDDKTIRVTNVRRDLDFLSDSLTPTGTDWELSEDGWIRDEEERLLAWVPPELRTVLMWPRTELLISTRGWLRLNFANACIGKPWAGCYKPPQDVPEPEIHTSPERNDLDGEPDKGENDTNDELKGNGEGGPAELS